MLAFECASCLSAMRRLAQMSAFWEDSADWACSRRSTKPSPIERRNSLWSRMLLVYSLTRRVPMFAFQCASCLLAVRRLAQMSASGRVQSGTAGTTCVSSTQMRVPVCRFGVSVDLVCASIGKLLSIVQTLTLNPGHSALSAEGT